MKNIIPLTLTTILIFTIVESIVVSVCFTKEVRCEQLKEQNNTFLYERGYCGYEGQ